MGVGVFCPGCSNTFAFYCSNCSSYETEVYESMEPLYYFQNRTIYYFKCRQCEFEYDYAICPVCDKNILPADPFVKGDKGRGTVKWCFIATACLGEHNKILKQLYLFRDEFLEKNHMGKIFIKIYYKYSPQLASWIHKNKLLKLFSKYLIVYPAYYASLLVMKSISFLKKL